MADAEREDAQKTLLAVLQIATQEMSTFELKQLVIELVERLKANRAKQPKKDFQQ
jgi:hypothetical protein